MHTLLEISINIENFNFGYTQLVTSLGNVLNFVNQYVDIVYITQNNVINNVIVQDPNINNSIWVKEMLINKINTNNFWLDYLLERLDHIMKIDQNVCISNILDANNYNDCLSEFHKCKDKFIRIDNMCKNVLHNKSIIIS